MMSIKLSTLVVATILFCVYSAHGFDWDASVTKYLGRELKLELIDAATAAIEDRGNAKKIKILQDVMVKVFPLFHHVFEEAMTDLRQLIKEKGSNHADVKKEKEEIQKSFNDKENDGQEWLKKLKVYPHAEFEKANKRFLRILGVQKEEFLSIK